MKTYENFLNKIRPNTSDPLPKPLEQNLFNYKFIIPVKVEKEINEEIINSAGSLDYVISGLEDKGVDAYWFKENFENFIEYSGPPEPEEEPNRDDFDENEDDDFNAELEEWEEMNQAYDEFHNGDFDTQLELYIDGEWNGNWNNFIKEFQILDSPNNLDSYEMKELFEILKNDFNDSKLEKYVDNKKLEIIDIRINDNDFDHGKFIVNVNTSKELSDAELEEVKDYLEGQCSDGWGEGFEQQDHDGWFIHSWWFEDDYEIEIVK